MVFFFEPANLPDNFHVKIMITVLLVFSFFIYFHLDLIQLANYDNCSHYYCFCTGIFSYCI